MGHNRSSSRYRPYCPAPKRPVGTRRRLRFPASLPKITSGRRASQSAKRSARRFLQRRLQLLCAFEVLVIQFQQDIPVRIPHCRAGEAVPSSVTLSDRFTTSSPSENSLTPTRVPAAPASGLARHASGAGYGCISRGRHAKNENKRAQNSGGPTPESRRPAANRLQRKRFIHSITPCQKFAARFCGVVTCPPQQQKQGTKSGDFGWHNLEKHRAAARSQRRGANFSAFR